MLTRDERGDVVFQPNTMYRLSDLNELESGLGDEVQRLIDNIRRYQDVVRIEKEQLPEFIGKYGFKNSEVYIDKGTAAGETIESCFENCSRNFQFADQFDM